MKSPLGSACGGGASGPSKHFRAYRSTSVQSVPASTSTKVAFNAESYDPEGVFDTANNRYSPGEAGYYHVSATALLGSMESGKRAYVTIYKNGSSYALGSDLTIGGANNLGLHVSGDVYLANASDYIEIYIWHNNSTSKDISPYEDMTWFTGHKIV